MANYLQTSLRFLDMDGLCLTNLSLDPKRLIGEQGRPRSDTAEHGI